MGVIHFDPILLEFLSNNILTLSLVFSVITVVAKTFKLTKIVDLVDALKETVLSIKNGKKVKGVVEDVGKKEKESGKVSKT